MHLPQMPRTNIRWLWLSAFVIVADQASKLALVSTLKSFQVMPLMPHLNLVHMQNTGAAFSMFDRAPAAVFILLCAVVSVAILTWLRRHPHGQTLTAAAFTLILGGALGNAVDRAMRGYVVDFVDFYVGHWHFAAFNLADSAITLGAGLLVLEMLLDWRRARRSGAAENGGEG
ncbi:MAG: signal peptidase II [Sinobacteraceae bacterium]|nr:signal peptidase II [Nevskiaceae bacterium]